MTKIRKEIEKIISKYYSAIDHGWADDYPNGVKELTKLFRYWVLEERKETLDELISMAHEKSVDYKPKSNVSYLTIKWDDLFEIVKKIEDAK